VTFRNFHICEAPGQWIITTKYFISKKRRNIAEHDWRANSLNPYNAENMMKFGNNILADDYGLMKKNYGQWLWGADNTGDITRRRNVLWFREYMRKWMSSGGDNSKIDLILGDGGLSTDKDPILLQKLELAQMIMVAACSSVGGNCIIKHFTPFIVNKPETSDATGFFMGFIYMYYLMFEEVILYKPYTSDPSSGEFYVIGKNFRGCSDSLLEKLLAFQDKFELNAALFKLEDIPETLIKQIDGFLDIMSRYNAKNMDMQVFLVSCYYDKDNVKSKHCETLLNPSKLKEIQIPRFKKWVELFGFV
jgi:hypothetical protein